MLDKKPLEKAILCLSSGVFLAVAIWVRSAPQGPVAHAGQVHQKPSPGQAALHTEVRCLNRAGVTEPAKRRSPPASPAPRKSLHPLVSFRGGLSYSTLCNLSPYAQSNVIKLVQQLKSARLPSATLEELASGTLSHANTSKNAAGLLVPSH